MMPGNWVSPFELHPNSSSKSYNNKFSRPKKRLLGCQNYKFVIIIVIVVLTSIVRSVLSEKPTELGLAGGPEVAGLSSS